MSGAMSAIRQRLLERIRKSTDIVTQVLSSAGSHSSSSVRLTASNAALGREQTQSGVDFKKDRANALSAKDERTLNVKIDQESAKKPNNSDELAPPVPKRPRIQEEDEESDAGKEVETASTASSGRKQQSATKPMNLPLTALEEDSAEALLRVQSTKEKESQKLSNEIMDLLNKPTAKELALVEKFKSDGSQMREFCTQGTQLECAKQRGKVCEKLHFRKIIQKHTDHSLGDCSFLNTCFHMDTCKFIHYKVDYSNQKRREPRNSEGTGDERTRRGSGGSARSGGTLERHPLEGGGGIAALDSPAHDLYPAQWLQCDLRFFDLSVLGKCSVVMADPPWDIHMELPYGTMSDDEMRDLKVNLLQDEGLIFLWVTGRAMELGRECLKRWGYKQCDELIWVKTNQLQRIIRTGRTGHWLNHGKEHCLIGVKGNAEKYYAGLDCDVIVAEVRATSHKPDEIYGVIERLSPGTRKVELFGRQHNVQPNWITLGNQLDGVRLLDSGIVERFKNRYPSGNCLPNQNDLKEYRQRQQMRGMDGRK